MFERMYAAYFDIGSMILLLMCSLFFLQQSSDHLLESAGVCWFF